MRAVAIVLHDVSPATLTGCRRLAAMIDEVAPSVPMTQLVVPAFHRSPVFTEHAEFRLWIESRLTHGDELALHGFYHVDDSAAPRSPQAWFARRVMTAGEGEFSALRADIARQRIQQGLFAFQQCGWRAAGFVPPAWQIGIAARVVLDEFAFAYTSTTRHLVRLPGGEAFRVPCFGFSARNVWRRKISILYNRWSMRRWRHEPFVRIALHPIDAMHADTLDAWRGIIRRLCSDRDAVTKSELLNRIEQLERTTALTAV